MSFWPKYYNDSCMKKLQLPFLKCTESMLTDRVATYGVKNKTLVRMRKINNERLSKTKQTHQMLSCSSSLHTWVSNSSEI